MRGLPVHKSKNPRFMINYFFAFYDLYDSGIAALQGYGLLFNFIFKILKHKKFCNKIKIYVVVAATQIFILINFILTVCRF
jgi:hypothetical protein